MVSSVQHSALTRAAAEQAARYGGCLPQDQRPGPAFQTAARVELSGIYTAQQALSFG